MTTAARLRSAYAKDAVSTASPGKLVVMLYDRCLKDLQVAEQAVVARQPAAAHEALVHAQDIVTELASTLDIDSWPEGANVKRLYEWVIQELFQANLKKDVKHIVNARDVMGPLRDAWAGALKATTGEQA